MTLPPATRNSAIVGMVGVIACVIGAFLDATAFFEAWLVTWLFLLGIALASMAQVMIHELTGGDWGLVLRQPLEAAALSLPLLLVLAVPLAFGLPHLFAWARPDAVARSATLQAQAWYLTPTRFIVREAILLVVWSLFALAIVRRRGATPQEAAARARWLSVVGLLVYLFTVTLAAFDWIASLVPGWASTTLGVRLGAAQFIASLGFAVPFLVLFRRARASATPARDYQDFGNLLLTYAMMWAYIAFTQYLIVWAEDLPDETSWFWPRAASSWRYLVIGVAALEFGVPVVAMLFRGVKRSARWLSVVCLLALAGQWLDTLWLTVPSVRPDGFHVRLEDLLALLGLGGVWLAVVLHLAQRVPERLRAAAATAPVHG